MNAMTTPAVQTAWRPWGTGGVYTLSGPSREAVELRAMELRATLGEMRSPQSARPWRGDGGMWYCTVQYWGLD